MEKFINSVTDDTTMSSKMQRVLSLVFLVITVVMIFIPYTKIYTFFGYEVWESNLKILPSFISTFIAILLIAPLYARNILKWNKSIYTLISFVLFLLIFGSLIELALGGNGLNSGIIEMIFVIAIALSWLGISAIAGICWILLFIAVAFSVVVNNAIMGFNGFIYIASAFIGLVLHSELNPGHLVAGFKEEFRISDGIKNAINTDIDAAGNLIKKELHIPNNKTNTIKSDMKILEGLNVDGINIKLMLEKINQRVEYLYDSEHIIEHTYFMSLKGNETLEELENIFKNKIIPLLQEYFNDDFEKIRIILADNQKEENYQFIKIKNDDKKSLFGNKSNDLFDVDKILEVYEINKEAFRKIESYIKIYEN